MFAIGTTFKGESLPRAFPRFVRSPKDRETMTFACQVELSAWRAVLIAHKTAPTCGHKLYLRRPLESAYRSLASAWQRCQAREYAQFLEGKREQAPTSPADLSYMAAQAVRLQLAEIYGECL